MKRTEHGSRNAQRAGGGAVYLHIERLVLDGFSLNAAQAARLQSTVKRDLGRMLVRTRAQSWNSGPMRQLQATPVHLAPGNSPAVWGRQIARTLFASLSPPGPAIAPPPQATSSPQIQTKS